MYEGRLKWIRMIGGMFKKHPNPKELTEFEKEYERGMEKGEEKKAIKIARNLLASNLSTELISNATGLSIEQINNLKEK